MGKNKDKIHKKNRFFNVRRGIIVALLLVIIGVGGAIITILNGVVQSEEQAKKAEVEQQAAEFLVQSKIIAQEYVQQRFLQRDRLRKELKREAGTTAVDLQVFLQSLLIKKEADIAQEHLKEVRKKRELLATFALQRFNTMTKEMLRLKDEVSRMQMSIDDLVRQAEEKERSGLLGSGGDLLSGIDNDSVAGINEENTESARRQSSSSNKYAMKKSDILKIREVRKFLEDNTVGSRIEPAKLLKYSSPDIANILSENTLLTITEVGGKVLLTLGSGLPAQESIEAEASRPMLFQALGENFQWVVKVTLRSLDVPPLPNVIELAEIIEKKLGLSNNNGVSGYIFTAEGLIRSFPENIGMKVGVPDIGWENIVAANISTYYQIEDINVAEDFAFTVGVCYELAHTSLRDKIDMLIVDSPQNAILLILALVVLLIAFVVIGVLGWKGAVGDGRVIYEGNAGNKSLDIDIRRIKPKLGSLKRLQSMNRGHSIGGSRILDFTRNEALQELVKRIRKGSAETGGNSSGDSVEGDNQLQAHKSGLREYLK